MPGRIERTKLGAGVRTSFVDLAENIAKTEKRGG